jgi:SPP1 family predicted phage head-tail adaptor
MLPMSDAEVAGMQETVEGTLPEVVTLIRVDLSGNGAGGQIETEVVVGTVAGSASAPKSAERKEAESLGVTEAVVITVPANTAISFAQRLRYNDVTYEIQSVPPEETWRTGIRVLCGRRATT